MEKNAVSNTNLTDTELDAVAGGNPLLIGIAGSIIGAAIWEGGKAAFNAYVKAMAEPVQKGKDASEIY